MSDEGTQLVRRYHPDISERSLDETCSKPGFRQIRAKVKIRLKIDVSGLSED